MLMTLIKTNLGNSLFPNKYYFVDTTMGTANKMVLQWSHYILRMSAEFEEKIHFFRCSYILLNQNDS